MVYVLKNVVSFGCITFVCIKDFSIGLYALTKMVSMGDVSTMIMSMYMLSMELGLTYLFLTLRYC